MADKPQRVRVLYCGVCGLPVEYFEYGPDLEKCKPWLRVHTPNLYPDLLKGIKLSNALKKQSKKFATGASVVKGPTEKEQIDVQGDIAHDIVEFITET